MPVGALVLAFAVVCPAMAGPGVPEAQGCHGGSESLPETPVETVAACCASVTVPKAAAPEVDLLQMPRLAGSNASWESRTEESRDPGAPPPADSGAPRFLRHAALLI